MNIAIQASDLDRKRIDGTRVYLKEMLKHFGTLAPNVNFLLYHRKAFNPELAPPPHTNYQERVCPFPVSWMQTRFVWELLRTRPEKLFLPIQAAPFFVLRKTEVTVTIHDLAFKRYPKTFPRWHVWKLNLLLALAVRRADKLIAVSQSTKDDLLEFFPQLDERNIRVIHHGFDGDFFGTQLSEKHLSQQLTSYQLKAKSYVLYVGALQPRKNLVRLIEAFAIAKKSVPEMKLVLAGEEAWLAGGILTAREKSIHKDDIILTGSVSFEALRALYQGARLFAFPSLYEGFGLPILEAFASGTPVLTAGNSSLREVGGRAALYCHAESVHDIAEKLERLWDDEPLRTELIGRGKKQLNNFSWDRCAQETLDYIRS